MSKISLTIFAVIIELAPDRSKVGFNSTISVGDKIDSVEDAKEDFNVFVKPAPGFRISSARKAGGIKHIQIQTQVHRLISYSSSKFFLVPASPLHQCSILMHPIKFFSCPSANT